MTKKLSIQELQELAISKNGILVSSSYIDIKAKLSWQCQKQHIFERSAFDVKYMSYWCLKCIGRHVEEDYVQWAKQINATYLGVFRVNKFKKIKLQCQNSHQWMAHPSHTKKGHGCPECTGLKPLTLSDANSYASMKNGKCISLKYKNANAKLQWTCHNNHEWSATLGMMRGSNTWCPICANEANRRWSKQDAELKAIENNGKFLSDSLTTRGSKYEWECKSGHLFNMEFDSILKGRWCPKCKLKTEQKVRNIFEEITNKKFPSKRMKWLYNPITKGTLCLDGYCEELKLAFEYDGEQHFMEFDHYDSSLLERQKNDELKGAMCKANNVTLIRVPYYVKDLETFILSEFQNFKKGLI